jgi:Icc-related predicted phosphoesterase
MSDLHFEFMTSSMRESFLSRKWPDHDICIIAGDLSNSINLYDSLKNITDVFNKVIYITGNHEYYGDSFDNVHQSIFDFSRCMNPEEFTWLKNDHVIIDGVTFYGGTLWYPEHSNPSLRSGINDFNAIKDFRNIYEEYKKFKGGLWDLNESSVIISHHLPLEQSIAEQYKNSKLNHFFLSDMSKQIDYCKPKLWIHGHTHVAFNYKVGNTQVVCNPLGYPMEFNFLEWKPVVVEICS